MLSLAEVIGCRNERSSKQNHAKTPAYLMNIHMIEQICVLKRYICPDKCVDFEGENFLL